MGDISLLPTGPQGSTAAPTPAKGRRVGLVVLVLGVLAAAGTWFAYDALASPCPRGKLVTQAPLSDGRSRLVCEADAQTQLEVELDGEGRLRQEIALKDGVRHGRLSRYSKSGGLVQSGKYIEGKRVGLWLESFEDGKRKAELRYQDDRLHGASQTWYPTGLVKSRGNYAHGKRVGAWEHFLPDGTATDVDVDDGSAPPDSPAQLADATFAGRPLAWWNERWASDLREPARQSLRKRARAAGLVLSSDRKQLEVSTAVEEGYALRKEERP